MIFETSFILTLFLQTKMKTHGLTYWWQMWSVQEVDTNIFSTIYREYLFTCERRRTENWARGVQRVDRISSDDRCYDETSLPTQITPCYMLNGLLVLQHWVILGIPRKVWWHRWASLGVELSVDVRKMNEIEKKINPFPFDLHTKYFWCRWWFVSLASKAALQSRHTHTHLSLTCRLSFVCV